MTTPAMYSAPSDIVDPAHLLTPSGDHGEKPQQAYSVQQPLHHLDEGGVLMSSSNNLATLVSSSHSGIPGTSTDTLPFSTSQPPYQQDVPEELPQQMKSYTNMDMNFTMTQPPGHGDHQKNLYLQSSNPRPEPKNCWGVAASQQQLHATDIAGRSGMMQLHHQYQHDYMSNDVQTLFNQPLSYGSSSVKSPLRFSGGGHQDSFNSRSSNCILNDDVLMSLSLKELRQILHKFPIDEVMHIEEKRKILKDREYRLKNRQHMYKLKISNSTLSTELHRLILQLKLITKERDDYKQRLDLLLASRGSDDVYNSVSSSGHSNPSTSWFQL